MSKWPQCIRTWEASVQKVSYIPVSVLIPEEWKADVLEVLAALGRFSWGDNDHSLVEIDWFIQTLEQYYTTAHGDEVGAWIESLRLIPNHIFVDMEE